MSGGGQSAQPGANQAKSSSKSSSSQQQARRQKNVALVQEGLSVIVKQLLKDLQSVGEQKQSQALNALVDMANKPRNHQPGSLSQTLRQLGGIGLLVRFITVKQLCRTPSMDCSVSSLVQLGLEALYEMVKDNQANRHQALESGLITALMQGVQVSPPSLPCDLPTLKIMSLILSTEASISLVNDIASTPLIPAMLTTLDTVASWQQSSAKTEWSTEVLCALRHVCARSTKGRKVFVEAGGVRVVVRIMGSSNDPLCLAQGLDILEELMERADASKALPELLVLAGGMYPLIRVLQFKGLGCRGAVLMNQLKVNETCGALISSMVEPMDLRRICTIALQAHQAGDLEADLPIQLLCWLLKDSELNIVKKFIVGRCIGECLQLPTLPQKLTTLFNKSLVKALVDNLLREHPAEVGVLASHLLLHVPQMAALLLDGDVLPLLLTETFNELGIEYGVTQQGANYDGGDTDNQSDNNFSSNSLAAYSGHLASINHRIAGRDPSSDAFQSIINLARYLPETPNDLLPYAPSIPLTRSNCSATNQMQQPLSFQPSNSDHAEISDMHKLCADADDALQARQSQPTSTQSRYLANGGNTEVSPAQEVEGVEGTKQGDRAREGGLGAAARVDNSGSTGGLSSRGDQYDVSQGRQVSGAEASTSGERLGWQESGAGLNGEWYGGAYVQGLGEGEGSGVKGKLGQVAGPPTMGTLFNVDRNGEGSGNKRVQHGEYEQVTILLNGRSLNAFSWVLCSASPVLKQLIEAPQFNGTIYIPSVYSIPNHKIHSLFSAAVEFSYTQQLDTPAAYDVLLLWSLAAQYGMNELQVQCRAKLWDIVGADVDVLNTVMAWCTEHDELGHQLRGVCCSQIINQLEGAINTTLFKSFASRYTDFLFQGIVEVLRRRLVQLVKG